MEPEMTRTLLRRHLEANHLFSTENPWTVKYSPLGGRGLFATRDIRQGELIFMDAPLILGPRCQNKYLPMCINCYKSGCPLFPCDRGCGLPVCSEKCESSDSHGLAECKFLRERKPTCGSMWSMDLLRAVVPIRGLSLSEDQKGLLDAFLCHQGPQHGREIELLKNNIEGTISDEDEALLLRVCTVFDTNSFETAAQNSETLALTSLRGLYPMGCLQNHCCVPNTRHHFDANQKMYVSAAIPIREGEELTMIYSDVLWDTMLRRQYLAKTKHFHCTCSRCSDRTEYGTLLGALKCAGLQCDGILLPNDPLDFNTSWTCNQCRLIISGRQIKSIQTGLGSIVQEMTYENPKKVFKFLQKELPVLVPSSNYIAMDLKFRIVSYFGRVEGFSWKELSKMELKFKLNYCKDLLTLLDTLGCGDCKKKGLIMYELYCTIMEERARDKANLDIQNESTEIQSDLESSTLLLQKAVQILQNDITVPDDYNKEVESLQTKLSIL